MTAPTTIRWGMIGCGSVTEVKSGPGFYKANNSVLLAVTSRRPETARSFAARHGIGKVYETTEGLLADPDIDIVYIATPPASHKEIALLAARAGKHVYVEKPMAMNATECREIVDACAAAGVRLFVAFYRRAQPRFAQVKTWIDDGAIGEPRCVRVAQFQQPAAEELSPDTLPWRVRPELAGGGKFLDMGVHVIDILDYWFGPIAEVHGIAANRGGLYDAEDTVTASWRHAGGVQGDGAWCYVCAHDEDRIEIIGSRGRIELACFNDSPLVLVNENGRQETAIANPQHVQQPFIQSIVDELNGQGACPGSVETAVRTNWVTDEILRGYYAAKAVR